MILSQSPKRISNYVNRVTEAVNLIFSENNFVRPLYRDTVNFKLVSVKTITNLNGKFRSINKPTDVLSFPQFNSVTQIPKHDATLGDIIICPAMCNEKHLSLKESIVHGMLHILGFDHEQNELNWNKALEQVKSNLNEY